MALNPKQQRFCEEYVIDLNATQAAIRAGYSEKTAQEQGARLLSNVMVQACVQELQQAKSLATKISAERFFLEIGRLAFSDVRNLFTLDGQLKNIHALDDDTAAAISSVEVVVKPKKGDNDSQEVEYIHKIKMWDKNSALEKIAKHLGIYAAEKFENKVTFGNIDDLHEIAKQAEAEANEYRNSRTRE